jgi:hypothetical protein
MLIGSRIYRKLFVAFSYKDRHLSVIILWISTELDYRDPEIAVSHCNF